MESLCTSRPRNRLGPVGAAGPSRRAAAVSGAAVLGRGERMGFLRLDRWGRAQYVCLHGVCFSFHCCLGRESHNLWLGTVHAVQPTLTPESRHLIRFHHQPYCLGHEPVLDFIELVWLAMV